MWVLTDFAMDYRFQQFSPAEAEAISGATTALHRDWRRRGILPPNEEGRHARFSTRDVAHLLALRSFSGAALSVAESGEAAQEAAVRTIDMLVPLFREDWHRHRWPAGTPQEKRFVVVTEKRVLVGSDLAALGPILARDGGSPVSVIYDCLLAARRILELAPRAVFVGVA